MGPYSKFIGAIIGGAIGLGVSVGLLPTEWSTPEVVGSLTTLISGLFTYAFPANT